MKLSAIIINFNTKEITEKVIRNFLIKEKDLDLEIILIDNGSKEKFPAQAAKDSGVKLIINEDNLGFARAVNQGIKEARGEYVLLLNSDCFVEENSISEMVKYLDENEGAGVIGPKFVYPDGANQTSSGYFPNLPREILRFSTLYKILPFGTYSMDFKNMKEVDWVSGGCMLTRKSVIEKIGLLDGNYFFGAEDMDFCLRAKKAGWKVIYYPQVKIIHHHGLSSGGVKSALRIALEKTSLDYFLKKNFPEKIFTRFAIRQMHDFKILLYKLKNMFKKNYKPKDATIAITYNCNSRCRMCNIWQIQDAPSLPLSFFDNLSAHLRHVNLSGGEPFLRFDLPEIVKRVRKASPRAQIIISSNGLATDLIVEQAKKILAIDGNIGIRISLDGIGQTHNEVRGITNIYERVMETIGALKKIGVTNLGFSFTIMDFNAKELPAVYDLSEKMNIQLALALVQNSDIYFQKSTNAISEAGEVEKVLSYVIARELKSWNLKRWLRAYYDYGLLYFARNKKRLLPSGAGFDSLFIDPNGDIYPSNLINIRMGNLGGGKLDKTWMSEEFNKLRPAIREANEKESWIICTIRGEIKRHWMKVGFWIVRNKILCQYANFMPIMRIANKK